MTHQFDIEIAEEVGINAAVIYQNIEYWCLKNKANNKNFYDNNYWTYNSIKAWKELIPYLSEKQIRTAIDKLISCNIIEVGSYNNAGYDRTKWYSIKGQMELPKRANGIAQKGEPIPDNKPDNKPDNISSLIKDVIEYLNIKAKKNFKAKSKKTIDLIKARVNDGFSLEDFKTVIDNKVSVWIEDAKYNIYLRPETLFGSKFESYLNENTKVNKNNNNTWDGWK